jgi:hypothetical protein
MSLHHQYVLGTAGHIPMLADQKGSFDLEVHMRRRLPLSLAAALGEPAKRIIPEVM